MDAGACGAITAAEFQFLKRVLQAGAPAVPDTVGRGRRWRCAAGGSWSGEYGGELVPPGTAPQADAATQVALRVSQSPSKQAQHDRKRS